MSSVPSCGIEGNLPAEGVRIFNQRASLQIHLKGLNDPRYGGGP